MNNMGNIMVKVEKDGNWLYLSTYDRKHGKSGRFLSRIEQVMDELKKNDYVSFVDVDCENFLHFRRNKDMVFLDFVWIRGNDDIRGYRQHAEISYDVLRQMCYAENSTQKFLCHAENSVSAKVDASNACRNIRRAIAEKHSRRAFIRAMRNSFRWKDECVTLYNDGQYDFFFQTDKGLCGGLIRHEYGGKITYSVHT